MTAIPEGTWALRAAFVVLPVLLVVVFLLGLYGAARRCGCRDARCDDDDASGGPRAILAWNVAGLLLLANIVVIAIVSTPVVAAFGPDRLNLWVMTTPDVWLPAVMVLTAWSGHLVVFRALSLQCEPVAAVPRRHHGQGG